MTTEPADSSPGTGTYELLRKRLADQARKLSARAGRLNDARLEAFGSFETALVGSARIRTENNCVPRDAVTVGDFLLFGYNVFIGLRSEVTVADVLSLHRLVGSEEARAAGERETRAVAGYELHPVDADEPANFLADPGFVSDFAELFRYYKDTKLVQLRRVEGRLLAVFQTGRSADDLKVFRWAVEPGAQGKVRYIDDRGEREHIFPPSHDFEWTPVTRDDHVAGRFPHINICDEVFVETTRGDLTLKVENNTETGEGVYSEPVEQSTQGLVDADISYARLGGLILLRILPYKEETWRYLVYNTRNKQVDRIDAIGAACQQLPEDHGLIFPGGYYLWSGERKTFDGDWSRMMFVGARRSPNGEDVLYAFHEAVEGRTNLLPYNLIRKEVAQPIVCHGYATFDDGTIVLFRAESDEPTRIHPMQIWCTPFVSDEHAAREDAEAGSFLQVIGNADLVRAISDCYSLERLAVDHSPSRATYEELVARTTRTQDAYHWLADAEVGELATPLGELCATAELVIDEFDKVETLRREAAVAVDEAAESLTTLRRQLGGVPRDDLEGFVDALTRLRSHRGHLISLRELRYVDLERIDELEAQATEAFDGTAAEMIDFVLAENAFAGYHARIDELAAAARSAPTATEATGKVGGLDGIVEQMALLTEVLEGLAIDDPTERTRVLEAVSEVLAAVNRGRATAEGRRRDLAATESAAEFSAQTALLSEATSGALALAATPEDCDEQLSRILARVEELEGRFGDLDEHLEVLATRREDIYEAFTTRKQALLDERQRQADRLVANAERVLDTIARRAAQLESLDDVNTYFATDAMVMRLRDIVSRLRAIPDGVRADELEGRLSTARQEAGRSLRDRQDLFEDGAQVIRFGEHRFTVNTQPIDLTLVPRRAGVAGSGDHSRLELAVTGTDFRERLDGDELAGTQSFWNQTLVSETDEVYRGEFLATSMLADAEVGAGELSVSTLSSAAAEDKLLDVVRRYAATRYDEGYERGVHDHDAALILRQLIDAYRTAELLRWSPRPRALACVFWAFFDDAERRAAWQHRAHSLARLREAFGSSPAIDALCSELAEGIAVFLAGIDVHPDDARVAGVYLFEELGQKSLEFATSAQAIALRDALRAHLTKSRQRRAFDADLAALSSLAARWQLVEAWFRGLVEATADPAIAEMAADIDEAVAVVLTDGNGLSRTTSSALRTVTVSELVGQHRRIESGALQLRLDEILDRTGRFRHERVPRFRQWMQTRERILDQARQRLRLGELKPKVMSAFVRNHLVDQVYLPLIGANLARQLGTPERRGAGTSAGEGRRTDQMGLLLLISPPGYGKTTLMEYIASRLGLVFVKVNGPALGTGVTSLDPAEAPDATARQEVEKISFALEMGNNVLLYLDDIQHTSPELLQKFISLCDAQRRMEGVWQGRTRTYDLRGKRFAMCMAGNPYTESGHRFQVPDMLANRADVYNLGDVLSGRDELFALSYVENALTSNPVLAPLAGRSLEDVALLVRMADGEDIPTDRLSHQYSSIEMNDVLSVLRSLRSVQSVVQQVNAAYIASASQDDAYRTEPPFRLQGSYRNMNKMVERIVPGMSQGEVAALIDDHYRSESQTLTNGAEHNLLKLAELRGVLSDAEASRWDEVTRSFARVQAMGRDDDPMTKVAGQLGLIGDHLARLADRR